MSLNLVMAIVAVISLVFSVANIVWTWWSKNNDASDKKVEEIETRVDDLKERIGKVEAELTHLPKKDDITALRLQVSEIVGTQKASEVELGSVARTVRRIEDHLLGVKS